MIKNTITFNKLKNLKHLNLSFSQEGEDLFLERYFNNISKGFYVDVGAYQPVKYSNTYLFYTKGWNGINIDPAPNVMELFNQKRPRDINLEMGVTLHESSSEYIMFNEPALNTFSSKTAFRRKQLKNHNIVGKKYINTFPLKTIFDKFLPPNQKIDFIDIDAEGLDLEVLLSNDWEKYRSKLILIEKIPATKNLHKILSSEENSFMQNIDYCLIGKLWNTLIFEDVRFS